MKKVLLLLSLCFSTVSVASSDPHWFDRRAATDVSWQLRGYFDHFVTEVSWVAGRGHPLYRISEHGQHEVEELAQDLAYQTPFSVVYETERHYYRVTWEQIKNEYQRSGLRSPYLQSLYQDMTVLNDRLHRIFNANPPTQWQGFCRVVLETVWGQDVRDFLGRSRSDSQSDAVYRARDQAWGMCEYERNYNNLYRCVVDQNRCYAVRTADGEKEETSEEAVDMGSSNP